MLFLRSFFAFRLLLNHHAVVALEVPLRHGVDGDQPVGDHPGLVGHATAADSQHRHAVLSGTPGVRHSGVHA